MQDSHSRVTKLLKAKETSLHKLAKVLVEKETLDEDQVRKIIAN